MPFHDPQQELFTELLIRIRNKGYDVCDTFLPPKGTPYPFVYLADSRQTDDANKSAVFGTVHQTIHVWHNNPRQRGMVSGMLLDIKTVCRQLEHSRNFAWYVRNMEQRILPDTTTKQPLLHGVLEIEFRFS